MTTNPRVDFDEIDHEQILNKAEVIPGKSEIRHPMCLRAFVLRLHVIHVRTRCNR